MKAVKLLPMLLLIIQQLHAQAPTNNKAEILKIVNTYSRCVVERDSTTFFQLFNDGPVTWCAAMKDRTQQKLKARGGMAAATNYFAGTYKGFMRQIIGLKTAEDKFDNIKIIEDGTLASVTMDYSFWANNKMSNWGGKYLTLIKRDGRWLITSVIYSLELTAYYKQPALNERVLSTL